jgi:CBS domain-containing protein
MRRLQRTIEDIGWSHDVPRLAASAPVAAAFDLMKGAPHDCVLVVDGAALTGIFTSRDWLNRVAAVGGDPEVLAVGAVMTPRPRTLSPRDPVAFAINWMAIEGFRNVPVVGDGGAVLGVLAVWDVMRSLRAMFDEIDAAPRRIRPEDDISGLVEIGGG